MEIDPREVDGKVAVKIFGFRRARVPKDINGENDGDVLLPSGLRDDEFTYPPRGIVPLTYFVPQYSIDPIQCKLLKNALRNMGYTLTIHQWIDNSYNIELAHPQDRWIYIYAESEEMGVCLAALETKT